MNTADRIVAARYWPLLAAAALLQGTVPMLRVATSYQAVEQGLSLGSIGLLSSGFALLPILFVVQIGRYSDRRGEARMVLAGGILVLASALGLWLLSGGFAAMLGFTLLLGIGQVMTVSGLQVATTHCSGPDGQDKVLGSFLIATALGTAVGPLLLTAATPAGELTPGPLLYPLLVGMTAITLAACLLLARNLPAHLPPPPDLKPVSLRELIALPGIAATAVASGICLATNDMIVVFMPALAAARGIEAGTVGLLLSLRAGASMASRIVLIRLVGRVGRLRLMIASTLAGALATLALALDLPVWGFAVSLCVAGFALGMALACTISATIALAPVASRATALSLRMTANRLGQFAIPLGAGTAAAALGPGSPFVIMALALFASGLGLVPRRQRG